MGSEKKNSLRSLFFYSVMPQVGWKNHQEELESCFLNQIKLNSQKLKISNEASKKAEQKYFLRKKGEGEKEEVYCITKLFSLRVAVDKYCITK